MYSESLKVPVKVARLPQDWFWGVEDRPYGERDMQVTIQRNSPEPVNFSGWTRTAYLDKLAAISGKLDALTRYRVRKFREDFPRKDGQFRVDPYVERLLDMVRPMKRRDRRTMVVGVTAADIFSGDNNFLFSWAATKDGVGAAILSYARMGAGFLNDRFQSRTRLVERLAKELVPASLKQLDIPRPKDPTDPYSYSSGVDRFAQKTMVLSPSTRSALDKFRETRE
jgi:predicted Zn-dependent protease